MAKISASLPDELKARLDAYIKDHPGTGVSEVVQTALEQFLSGGAPVQPSAPPPVTPPAPPSPPSISNLDQVARDYVLNLAIHVDNMRKAMASAGLWAPPPLVPPPWWQYREAGEIWAPTLKMERKTGGKKKNPPE